MSSMKMKSIYAAILAVGIAAGAGSVAWKASVSTNVLPAAHAQACRVYTSDAADD